MMAKYVADNYFTVISMNISTYLVVVMFSTSLSKAELREKGFPFPIPEGEVMVVEN